MSLTFKLKGDKELIARLNRMGRKEFRRATRDAAKMIQARAQELAPVDTGLLSKSIKVRSLKRTRGGKIGSQVVLRFGAKANSQFYGAFQELGTKKMKARRFMKQAAKEMGAQAIQSVRDRIAQEVRE